MYNYTTLIIYSVINIFSTQISVLEMKIWIYWSKLNSWIYFYIVLNKNRKIYWSEQWYWARGLVLIVRTEIFILLTFLYLNLTSKNNNICPRSHKTFEHEFVLVQPIRKLYQINKKNLIGQFWTTEYKNNTRKFYDREGWLIWFGFFSVFSMILVFKMSICFVAFI
jgi:hypothetical protein